MAHPHGSQPRTAPKSRKLAAAGFGIVALGCGGILAVLIRFAGSMAVFASGSPGRGAVIYLAASFLFAVVGATILLSSAPLSAGQRWATWGLSLLLAVLSLPLASVALPIWLVPLWLMFRYAASAEP